VRPGGVAGRASRQPGLSKFRSSWTSRAATRPAQWSPAACNQRAGGQRVVAWSATGPLRAARSTCDGRWRARRGRREPVVLALGLLSSNVLLLVGRPGVAIELGEQFLDPRGSGHPLASGGGAGSRGCHLLGRVAEQRLVYDLWIVIGSTMQSAGERALTGVGIAILIASVMLVLVLRSADRAHLDGASRVWRRLNLLTSGLVVLLAIDLLPDFAEETEWAHRADEAVIQLLALAALAWYAFRRRRLGRSLVPLVLAMAVEVVKLAAIPVEWNDTADVQGDIVLALVGVPVLTVLTVLYVRLWSPP